MTMHDLVWVAVGALFTTSAACTYVGFQRRRWRRALHSAAAPVMETPREPQEAALGTPVPPMDTDPIDVLTKDERRAVDPGNPPRWMRYAPREGASVKVCVCHSVEILPGAMVLLWPIREHPEGAVDLFCERIMDEVGA